MADLAGGSGDTGLVTVADGHLRVPLAARGARVLIPVGADLTPPPPPGRVRVADTGPGSVELEWEPVAGAARYQVWRSLVSGGGYVPVGETQGASFTDQGVRNGSPAYHVVTALDPRGNVSARSPEVSSLPQVAITAVTATDPASREVALSLSGPPMPVRGTVAVAQAASTDPASGIRVQVGVGPAGSEPGDGWSWTDATPSGDGPDAWTGGVHPDTPGTFATALRASADGGRTWVVSDAERTLGMLPDPDPGAPAAPTGLALLDVAADHVTMRWSKDATGAVARYVVLRGTEGQDPVRIATTADALFTDVTVEAGTRYRYRVAAQDDGADTSPPSAPLDVVAEEQLVTVTFRVTVPAGTPADAQLYIAGDFQGWAPGDTPMTHRDDATWSIDLPFESGTAIEYKYTRGSWEAVEKDEACGEIPNRRLTVDGSAGPAQLVEDVVARWRDLDACP
jgi:hypothetical protein